MFTPLITLTLIALVLSVAIQFHVHWTRNLAFLSSPFTFSHQCGLLLCRILYGSHPFVECFELLARFAWQAYIFRLTKSSKTNISENMKWSLKSSLKSLNLRYFAFYKIYRHMYTIILLEYRKKRLIKFLIEFIFRSYWK